MKVTVDIESCAECPFSSMGKIQTMDIFSDIYELCCRKASLKQIVRFNKRDENKLIEVPIVEWCHFKIE